MTDYKQLCAELADALDNAIRVIYHEDGTLHISTAYPLLDRARAALAEPQPAADGEVARLVSALREWQTVPLLEERRRAAELLEQLAGEVK